MKYIILITLIHRMTSFSIPGVSTKVSPIHCIFQCKVYEHGGMLTTYMNELDSVSN